MEPASGIIGLVVIGTLHSFLTGDSWFICRVRNTSDIESRDTNIGTQKRRGVIESDSGNPILPIHIGTLDELLVGVLVTRDRLTDAISTCILKGLKPREVEDTCVCSDNETLLIDDPLIVHAIRFGELLAIGGALP
jgi:hypothetical protein